MTAATSPKRIAISLLALSALSLQAQTIDPRPRLTASPARPEPGSLVHFRLSGAGVASVTGTMAGEPLHFTRGADSVWHAIGAVPVDAARSVVAHAAIADSSGTMDSTSVTLNVPPLPKAKAEPLKVDSEFTAPQDAALKARIERENALARQVGQSAHAAPALWTAPFERPRATRVTSSFGSGRVFNGAATARHLGVDFAGKTGEAVRAANRGVVALVDTFFLAGKVIYIDHGGGVVTGYFHLSKPLVAVGDTVAKGQEIGLVGATGRVTAAHLHWTARYGAITFNPMDLLRLRKY
ncbi:MAG TPA: M23 family metallopeptidase [Gemmatimonadaceae bacterium]|nr:M23 family metallopeptidase [Gemmatimonadaceae bacterium]